MQAKPAAPEEPKKPTLDIPTAGHEQKRTPSASPDRTTIGEGLSQTGKTQEFKSEGYKTSSENPETLLAPEKLFNRTSSQLLLKKF